jgi:hypothetical protein
VAFFVLLALVFFAPVLTGRVHLETDYFQWLYPWRQAEPGQCVFLANNLLGDPLFMYVPQDILLNRSLKAGVLPLWNPYAFCGFPLQALGHPSITYPPRLLLHLALPPLVAREVLLFGHLVACGFFCWAYLRALGLTPAACLLGGVAWMLGGFAMAYLEFEYVTLVCAWIPLALLLVERRAFGWLALAVGLMTLVGHWQYVGYGLLLIAAYAAHRRAFGALPGLFLGLGVAAVQLLPSLELMAQSQRPFADPATLFASNRFLPENLLTLFLSDALGHPAHHFYLTRLRSGVQNYVDLCGYMGPVTLMLAVWGAPRSGFFAGVAGLALLYAMGTPGVTLLAYVIPGFLSFVPSRVLVLYCFAVAVLAAYGLDRLERRPHPRFTAWALAFWSLVTAGFIAFCLWLSSSVDNLQRLMVFYREGSLFDLPAYCQDRAGFVTAVAESIRAHYQILQPTLAVPLALAWVGLAALHRRPSRWQAILVGCVALDLLYFGMRFNVTFPAASAYPPAPGIAALGEGRAAGLIRPIHPNLLTAYGVRDVAGYASLFPRRYFELIGALSGHASSYLMADLWEGARYTPGAARLLAVRYHYTDPWHELPERYGRLVHDGDLRVYEVTDPLPRFYLVPEARVASDVLAQVTRPDFDPGRVVYLEQEVALVPGRADVRPRVQVLDEGPNFAEVEVASPTPAFLVCSDTYYEGWVASIDGVPAPIYRANYCFRAVAVPAGTHRLRMAFRPWTFRAGLAVSLISLAVALAWGRRTRP